MALERRKTGKICFDLCNGIAKVRGSIPLGSTISQAGRRLTYAICTIEKDGRATEPPALTYSAATASIFSVPMARDLAISAISHSRKRLIFGTIRRSGG